ncbi:MAG: hypothetical protein NVSMB49_16340 [Ktedonobacteraceae bacterium]
MVLNCKEWKGREMRKSFQRLTYKGTLSLESDMRGNSPVSFGKGATEKG